MTPSAEVTAQPGAERLLAAALAGEPAHAYLFHGPSGVGKRAAARAFAGALLGDQRRVEAGTHPDLRVIEALGDMIRIDEIRALHHDLHLRPFEADRRVYLLFDAHLMNAGAADALLKDLEEPPAYATLVLVADALGPVPETIRSRCQLISFRRLSEPAVRAWVDARSGLGEEEARAVARSSSGRLDRAARLLDEAARARRSALIVVARSVYGADVFDPAAAAAVVAGASTAAGAAAAAREKKGIEELGLPSKEAELRVRRATRGAEREELLAAFAELESWFRDLVVVEVGAERAVANADHLAELRGDAPAAAAGAAEAAEAVRDAWRVAEELNVNASLWLEALFVRLRRAFR